MRTLVLSDNGNLHNKKIIPTLAAIFFKTNRTRILILLYRNIKYFLIGVIIIIKSFFLVIYWVHSSIGWIKHFNFRAKFYLIFSCIPWNSIKKYLHKLYSIVILSNVSDLNYLQLISFILEESSHIYRIILLLVQFFSKLFVQEFWLFSRSL